MSAGMEPKGGRAKSPTDAKQRERPNKSYYFVNSNFSSGSDFVSIFFSLDFFLEPLDIVPAFILFTHTLHVSNLAIAHLQMELLAVMS